MRHFNRSQVDESVLELLELANFDSPLTGQLLKTHCRSLTDRLVSAGKIDEETADSLCHSSYGN